MDTKNTYAICGSTGFIGKELTKHLKEQGHTVLAISRKHLTHNTNQLTHLLTQAQIVINLAGAPVSTFWTKKAKKKIYNSRILSTRKLVETIASLPPEKRPLQLINTSAVGIYVPTNQLPPEIDYSEDNFLATVCRDWEAEATKVAKANVKLSIVRLGIVLGKKGGALPKMAKSYKFGVSTILGSGNHLTPFVHIKDIVQIYTHLAQNQDEGIFDAVSPQLVDYAYMGNVLAEKFHAKLQFHIPEFIIRFLFGKMSSILLQSPAVSPNTLISVGYKFQFPYLRAAIDDIYR